jgi:pimeloyl-ACP methyl ester carboxylesterase
MTGARGPRARRVVMWLSLVALGLYALVCAIFWAIQDRLLYFPAHATAEEEATVVASLVAERVRSRHGDTLGYLVRSETPAVATLIATHGNGGQALGQERVVTLARQSGLALDVFLVEYPGYGARAGTPSERANVAAVREAMDHVDGPLFLLGESLGSAVVALAAAEAPERVRALVLVTPLPNLLGPTRHHYPFLPTFLLADTYEGDAAIARFGGPVAFIVASEDEVIPSTLALAMHRAYAGPKVLFVEEGARHNTVRYAAERPSWRGVARFLTESLQRTR